MIIKRWLKILEQREIELMRFLERPMIKQSPDYRFYLQTLGTNRRLQMTAQELLH